MTFSNPLGFIALAAIPVLIIIYIIKSKYTEQTIPSTYLWTLSERFLKRKNPLKAITGLISLILQILAVIFIALAIAGPVFIIKDGAADYCFIVDGSASMNVVENGQTRFDKAKAEVTSLISSAAGGSTYTLVVGTSSAEVIYKGIDDKKTAISRLDETSSSFDGCDLSAALSKADEYFKDNNSMKFYLITDREIDEDSVKNVSYINVASATVNYSLSDVTYTVTSLDDGSEVTVSGTVYCYFQGAEITVNAYIGESGTAAETVSVQAEADTATAFTLSFTAEEFSSLRVTVANSDSLMYDNEVKLYSTATEGEYSALIVSDGAFFIEAALTAAGVNCETITSKEYSASKCVGYNLYVFDADDKSDGTGVFSPTELPTDGAVWFINPQASVNGANFSVRGTETTVSEVTWSTSSKGVVKKLLKGTTDLGSYAPISSYKKCGLNSSFYTVMSADGNPVIFAGANRYQRREVVFAFDFNDSDFPISYNGRVILNNIIKYTFPDVVDETEAYSGDIITLNVLSGCTSLKVVAPSQDDSEGEYLDTTGTVASYELTEVGEYKIVATVGGATRTSYLYASYPEEERQISGVTATFILDGEAGTDKRDGKYEDLLYIFIILGILILADWAVYCYEQYQLR